LLVRLLTKASVGLQVNDHIVEPGDVVFRHACQLGFEGIVSKRLGSPYVSGRSRHWVKSNMQGTTRGRCRPGSGTRISSTRCATPSWRRIGSRISGDRVPRDPTRFRTIQVCPKAFCLAVKYQQWGLAWESYVLEALGTKRTNTGRRQHVLLLALSEQPEPVSKGELRRLNPKLAEMYATKTPKTLSRDLNELTKKGLISTEGDKVRANKEVILAFLPGARAEDREAQLEESTRLTNEGGQLLFDF
jgi:hypothetical protein